MKYGKIYTYENRNEAEIGRSYFFFDFFKDLCGEQIPTTRVYRLGAVKDESYPFANESGYFYQFICEIIEEEPTLMTNRQLAEWFAKGNGQYKFDEIMFFSHLTYYYIEEDEPVGESVRIRPWGSDEWIVPTVDIYERDCR